MTILTHPNGYGFMRTFTAQASQIPSGLTGNFPVLVSGTYASLATVANGGKIQNGAVTQNGYGVTIPGDVIFTSDAAGVSLLNWEWVSYTSTTGTVVVWVQVNLTSSMVGATPTVPLFYMWYGKSSQSTDALATASHQATWDTSYNSVFHLNGLADSVTTGYTLTNTGSVTTGFNGPTGLSAGAIFSGTNYLTHGSPSYPSGTAVRTLSTWFKFANTTTGFELCGWGDNSANFKRFSFYYTNDGKLYIETATGTATAPWTADTSWHHAVATLPSGTTTSSIIIYIDGVAKTVTGDGSTLSTNITEWKLGGVPGYTGGLIYVGNLSETRVSNVARSANYITAEYNTGNAPASFYTLSGEQYPIINQRVPRIVIRRGEIR